MGLVIGNDVDLAGIKLDISKNNTIMMTNQSKDGCWRACHPDWTHKNVLLLNHYGRNGLGDRMFIINHMATLAGYLCAVVYIPPPYTMVSYLWCTLEPYCPSNCSLV